MTVTIKNYRKTCFNEITYIKARYDCQKKDVLSQGNVEMFDLEQLYEQ